MDTPMEIPVDIPTDATSAADTLNSLRITPEADSVLKSTYATLSQNPSEVLFPPVTYFETYHAQSMQARSEKNTKVVICCELCGGEQTLSPAEEQLVVRTVLRRFCIKTF